MGWPGRAVASRCAGGAAPAAGRTTNVQRRHAAVRRRHLTRRRASPTRIRADLARSPALTRKRPGPYLSPAPARHCPVALTRYQAQVRLGPLPSLSADLENWEMFRAAGPDGPGSACGRVRESSRRRRECKRTCVTVRTFRKPVGILPAAFGGWLRHSRRHSGGGGSSSS